MVYTIEYPQVLLKSTLKGLNRGLEFKNLSNQKTLIHFATITEKF